MTEQPVLVQHRTATGVLVATLNRPSKGNALNRPLIDALDQLARDLEHPDSDVGALVITGAGDRAFSAGADINELDGIGSAAARAQMRRGQLVFDRLERLPVVVIAALNGVALGGGLELAMAADLRVAAEGARVGQPEITLGNVPGWGGTQRLPRLIGRGLATELILTGDHIDAVRAHSIGLVNQVAADAVASAVALATRIAARSPTAVRVAKHAIRIGLERGVEVGLNVEADAVAVCCDTPQQQQAVRAFLDRRTTPRAD